MRIDLSDEGILSSPETTTYQSIENFLKKHKAPEDQYMLRTPPVPGQRIGTAARNEPIKAGQYYSKESVTVAPSPQAKWVNLPSTTPGGGGQYIHDPEQAGRLIKIDREKQEKDSDRILARRGLSSAHYQVDHIVPIWAGGTDEFANKMILPIPDHNVKSKVENVARQLFYDGRINLSQARMLALNWEGRNVDRIPVAVTGRINSNLALIKYNEWNADPNQGIFKKTADAYARWGLKDSIKTLFNESDQRFHDRIDEAYTTIEKSTVDAGLAGVAQQWAAQNSIDLINALPIGAANIVLPKKWEVKPLKSLEAMGVEKVKGYEDATDWARAVGHVTGNLAGMILSLKAIGTVAGGASKYNTYRKAQAAIAGKYGKTALITKVVPIMDKTYQPFKKIPILKQIVFKGTTALHDMALFGIYSQLTPHEQNGINARASRLGRELAMGVLFGGAAAGSTQWRSLGSASTVVGSGTYVVARLNGADHSEAMQEAIAMAAFHFALGADQKLFGKAAFMGSARNVAGVTTRTVHQTLDGITRGLKMKGIAPEARPGMKPEELTRLEKSLIDEVHRQKDEEIISTQGFETTVFNIEASVRWMRINELPEGNLKTEKTLEFLEELSAMGRGSAKGKHDAAAAANERMNEFHAYNPEYIKSGEVENTTGVDTSKARGIAKIETEITGASARESAEMNKNLNDLIEPRNKPNAKINIELTRNPELARYIERRNEYLRQQGRDSEVDPYPKNQIVVKAEVNGRFVDIGELPKDIRNVIAKQMDKLGVDILPASVKMTDIKGEMRPDVDMSRTDPKVKIEVTPDHWEMAIIGSSKVKAANANRVYESKQKRPVEVEEKRRMRDIRETIGERILNDRSLGSYDMRAAVGFTIERMAGDPVHFNKTYSKNPGKNPIIEAPLVERIRKNPETVQLIDLVKQVQSAWKQGKINPKRADLINNLKNLDSKLENFETRNNLKGFLLQRLSDVNLPGQAGQGSRPIAIALKKYGDKLKDKTSGIARTLLKGKPSGKPVEEMTVKDAITAPEGTFNSWVRERGQRAIGNKRDIEKAKELFDAYIGRGMIDEARTLANVLGIQKGVTDSVKKDFAKLQKSMESKLKSLDLAGEVKQKRPKTPTEKVKAAIKQKPTAKEDELPSESQFKKQTAKTAKQKPILAEDNPAGAMKQSNKKKATVAEQREMEAKMQDIEVDKINKDDLQVKEDRVKIEDAIEEGLEHSLEVQMRTDPESIRDPKLKKEALAYRDFYAFDSEGKLTYGNDFMKNKIAEYKQAGNKKMVAEAKKDIEQFSRKNMARRADSHFRKNKGNYLKSQEAFIKEFAEVFAKYGNSEVLSPTNKKAFANRQKLRRRFIDIITARPNKLVSVVIKPHTGGQESMTRVVTDNLPRAESYLYKVSRAYEKKDPRVNLEHIQFNPRGSKNWLDLGGKGRQRSQNDIFNAIENGYLDPKTKKMVSYVSLGRSKNTLQSITAVRYNEVFVHDFDKNPRDFLPKRLHDELIRDGRADTLSKHDKFLYVYARKVLGMHDAVNTNVIIERAQLFNNKNPVNMANQGGKYNIVTYRSKIKLGDTLGKTLEQFIKDNPGQNKDVLTELYNRDPIDGNILMTKEAGKELGLVNGYVHDLDGAKPYVAAQYRNPENVDKLLLMKGYVQIMDSNMQKIIEKQAGKKLGKYDIVTTDNNVKFGLEERIERDIASRSKRYVEQQIDADGIRFDPANPHEAAGSFGPHIISKLPAGSKAGKYVEQMFKNPIEDFQVFTNLLKGPTNGKDMIKIFNHFIDEYHIDIPNHMYKEIAGSISAGAGIYTHEIKIRKIIEKLLREDVGGGHFLKRDYLKLVPDYGYLNGRFLKDGEVIISRRTFNKLFAEEIKAGEIVRASKEDGGHMIWKATGKPVQLASARYPVNSFDNVSSNKIYIGDYYGVKNLGEGHMIMSHWDVYARKNGDYDGDTAAIFAFGKGKGKIPEELADIFASSQVILPTEATGTRRPKQELSSNNIREMSSRVWVGEQAINNIHAATRVMEAVKDSGARLVAKNVVVTKEDGSKAVNRIVDVYFGNSNVPFRPNDKPLLEIDHVKNPNDAKFGEEVVATVKYGDAERQLAKMLSGKATDAAKDDWIYNWLMTQPGVDKSNVQFYKHIMFRNFWRQSGKDRLEDPAIIQALHNLDKYFQVPHNMIKKKTKEFEIELPDPMVENWGKFEKGLEGLGQINDAIIAGGGQVHPSMKMFDHLRGYKDLPEYNRNKKLQFEADKKGRDMTSTLFSNKYDVRTFSSPGYKGLEQSVIKDIALATTRIEKATFEYNKYMTMDPDHNKGEYRKWNTEVVNEYDRYVNGALKTDGEVLSRERWERQTNSPDQLIHKVPGQTYEQYLHGTGSPLTAKEWRVAIGSGVRKKMILELKKLGELDQAAIDRIVNYMILSPHGNIKNHPGWQDKNADDRSTYVWRYDEFIQKSPAQAEVYYMAKESYVDSKIKKEAEASGKIIKDYKITDAEEAMAKHGETPEGQQNMYWDMVDDFRKEMEGSGSGNPTDYLKGY